MKLERNSIVAPFKSIETIRPWGYFSLFSDNEINTTKVLFLKPTHSLSMQYHFKRCQLYMPLDTGFIVQYSSIPVSQEILKMPDDEKKFKALNEFLDAHLVTEEAKENSLYGFYKYIVHRTTYTGKRDYGRVLDIAYPLDEGDENDENDIFRITDFYGRQNIK